MIRASANSLKVWLRGKFSYIALIESTIFPHIGILSATRGKKTPSFFLLVFGLGLRRVSPRIRVDARQPWISKMNEIQRVSTDFRLFLPGG